MRLKNFFYIITVVLISLYIIIFNVQWVMAATINSLLDITAGQAKYDTGSKQQIYHVVGNFIGVFLSFLGVIFICLAIYAGYMWMTAAGDEEKVAKAKDTLKDAVIGLIITIGAYALTYFVLYYLASSGIQIKEGFK